MSIRCTTNVAFVEDIATLDTPREIGRGHQLTVDVTLNTAFAPALILIGNGDHVPFSCFEFELDAMLKDFLLQLGDGDHQAVANEMCGITVTFGVTEPEEIRFFLLDHAVHHRIDAKPSGNSETIRVGPGLDRRKNDARAIPTGEIEEFIRPMPIGKVLENTE